MRYLLSSIAVFQSSGPLLEVTSDDGDDPIIPALGEGKVLPVGEEATAHCEQQIPGKGYLANDSQIGPYPMATNFEMLSRSRSLGLTAFQSCHGVWPYL